MIEETEGQQVRPSVRPSNFGSQELLPSHGQMDKMNGGQQTGPGDLKEVTGI